LVSGKGCILIYDMAAVGRTFSSLCKLDTRPLVF
jgi:hypothetical protein